MASGAAFRAVCRGDAVHLSGDEGDAFVRHAEFPGGLHRVRSEQIDRGGHAGRRQRVDSIDQVGAVGDRFDPETAQEIGRRGGARTDDAGAREPRELNGKYADPTSRATDQHGVLRARVDHGERGRGGVSGDGERGCGAIVDVVGRVVCFAARGYRSGPVDDDVIGDRPRERAAEYAVTDGEFGHAVADLIHDSGVVGSEAARQAQAETGGGVGIGGHEPIHRVQAGSGHPHPDPTGACLWRGHGDERQVLGPTERLELHRPTRGRRRAGGRLHDEVPPRLDEQKRNMIRLSAE